MKFHDHLFDRRVELLTEKGDRSEKSRLEKRPFRRLGESQLITCGSILIPHSFEMEDPILAPRATGSVARKVNQNFWMGYVFVTSGIHVVAVT